MVIVNSVGDVCEMFDMFGVLLFAWILFWCFTCFGWFVGLVFVCGDTLLCFGVCCGLVVCGLIAGLLGAGTWIRLLLGGLFACWIWCFVIYVARFFLMIVVMVGFAGWLGGDIAVGLGLLVVWFPAAFGVCCWVFALFGGGDSRWIVFSGLFVFVF